MHSTKILVFVILSYVAVILAAPANPPAESEIESFPEENSLDLDGNGEIESLEWNEFEKDLLEVVQRSFWTRIRDRLAELARARLAAEAASRVGGALLGT
ncbi:unnamed protein product [Allacma fusca]|uniref:Uncharacterized protein n=1 Tax=Allacma fusca TaxID=39272 RepID=A0A8J2KW36_9HEXA|nr:unnamed protein product [Allacma fusca]